MNRSRQGATQESLRREALQGLFQRALLELVDMTAYPDCGAASLGSCTAAPPHFDAGIAKA